MTGTLLGPSFAQLVTHLSQYFRVSIRVAAVLAEAALEAVRYGAKGSLDYTKFLLCSHLDLSAGVYLVRHTFTLAELLTMASLDLMGDAVKFSFSASDQLVAAINELFGSTETSAAISAFIELLANELFRGRAVESRAQFYGTCALSLSAYFILAKRAERHRRSQLITLCMGRTRINASDVANSVGGASNRDAPRRERASEEPAGCQKSASSAGVAVQTDSEYPSEESPGITPRMDDEGVQPSPIFLEEGPPTRGDLERAAEYPLLDQEKRGLVYSLQARERVIEERNRLRKKPSYVIDFEGEFVVKSPQHGRLSKKSSLDAVGMGGASENGDLFELSDAEHSFAEARDERMRLFLAPAREARPPLAEAVAQCFPRRPLLRNVERFCRFASAAYGKRFMRALGIGDFPSVFHDAHDENHHCYAHHCGLRVEDVVQSSFQSSGLFPDAVARGSNTLNQDLGGGTEREGNPIVHFLSVDHESRAVVLAFRGTLGLADLLADLTCEYEELVVYVEDGSGARVRRGFKAHRGMLETARAASRHLAGAVGCLFDAYPTYGLVLTGHSLGAGVAAMLAVLWSDRLSEEVYEPLGPSPARDEVDPHLADLMHCTALSAGLNDRRPLACFAYGCPAVCSHELSRLCASLVTSVVHGGDFVPQLSFGIVQDMSRVLDFFSENRGLAELAIFRGLEITPGDADGDWLRKTYAHVAGRLDAEKLYPCGSIYWLQCTPGVERRPLAPGPAPSSLFSQGAGYVSRWCSWLALALYRPTRATALPVLTSPERRALDSLEPLSPLFYKDNAFVSASLDRIENPRAAFGTLALSGSMLSDHSPKSYEDAIRCLAEGLRRDALSAK